MTIIRTLLTSAVLGTALCGSFAPAASAFGTLDPGGPPQLSETVPVQVVMLGYEPDQVPAAPLTAALPSAGDPLMRQRWFFWVDEPVGLSYRYDYDLVYPDDEYEDAFFAKLKAIGVSESEVTGYRTSFGQFLYNQQKSRVLDVKDNLVIDGTAVEQ